MTIKWCGPARHRRKHSIVVKLPLFRRKVQLFSAGATACGELDLTVQELWRTGKNRPRQHLKT